MRIRWDGKNVDFGLLSTNIKNFFQSKGFETEIVRFTSTKYKVLARVRQPSSKYLNLEVKVYGDPNGFVVDFSTTAHIHSSVKLGFLTIPFGGGSLLLRGVRLKETLERLEGEFWAYVQEVVSGFANSTV